MTEQYITTTKMNINNALQQLGNIQIMFLMLEPRGIGLDENMVENMVSMISDTRRNLRRAQSDIEKLA